MKKIVLLSLAAISVLAAETVVIPVITVEDTSIDKAFSTTVTLPDATKNTGDSASALKDVAGVSTSYNGGLATLPAIHGLADTRVKIDVDGMTITSACPNHMNPAMSYVNTAELETMEVMAGITPVSYGGDSIGGTIVVKSKAPQFAEKEGEYIYYGDMSAFERSNGGAVGVSANVNAATDKVNIGFSGFAEKSGNYRDGNNNIVKDTLYSHRKKTLSMAYKIDAQNVLSAQVSKMDVDYEGFPNQYMDMLGNSATNTRIGYKGRLWNISIDADVFQQNTNHYMNKILTERTGNMPMYTDAKEKGYNLKLSLPLTDDHTLKFGSDGDYYTLNDYWPPDTVNHKAGMNPNTFININDGHRDRIGFYIEEVAQWSSKFSTNVGFRNDLVSMNTGDVSGYNTTMNDPVDAAAFNALSHSKKDTNYDFTVMAKYEYSDNGNFELGYARKTRSPDLYERYTWAGGYGGSYTSNPIAMDMRMINTYGDGNGYVGNIDLKPEIANTVSATFGFHDATQNEWGVKLTPYYTVVKDYIDVQYLGTSAGGINYLKFVNTDALLYGADVSGYANVWNNETLGKSKVKTVMGYTRGMRKNGGELYHMMPFHAKVSLDNVKGAWNTGIDVETVTAKNSVDTVRNEPETAAYTLVDLRAGYQINKNIRFDLAVTNLFDQAYAMPLGGVDVVNYAANTYTPLQGKGRSIDSAVTIKF